MTVTARFGLINIPIKKGARAWLRCWVIMALRCSVLVVNESLSPRQRRVYRAAARARGWGQFGLQAGPNPVFFSRLKWRKLAGSVVELHGPGPWVEQWPGYNSGREVTVAALQHRRSGLRLVMLGTHLVSDGDKNPVDWRAQVRETSKTTLEQLVQGFRDDGSIVVLAGDMNIRAPFPLGPRFQWIRGEGIDKVGVALPAGVDLEHSGWRLVTAPTDHKHGVIARLTLTNKEPA